MFARRMLAGLVTLCVVAVACGDDLSVEVTASEAVAEGEPEFIEHDSLVAELRDPDVPDLPFPDNPDPDQCGIPIQWGGGQAFLTGVWEGDLIQPDVLLYDSHQRLSIAGQGAHGAEVSVVLYQENPVLDFYMVKVIESGDQGWVPEHFVSFGPVA